MSGRRPERPPPERSLPLPPPPPPPPPPPKAPAIGEVGERADAVLALVERLRARVPLHRDRLAGRRLDSLADVPTTSKADLAGYGPFPLGDGPPSAAVRIAATSGTTGPRLFVGYSGADWDRIAAALRRRAIAVGFGTGDLLLNTHGHGLWIGGPTLDLLATVAGAGLLPAGPGNSASVLEWLAELPVTALAATPSYLRFLVERARAEGVDPASWGLRYGFLGGEGASPALRASLCSALGPTFRWIELYGSTEVGGPVLGAAVPRHELSGHLLVDTEELIVELLHPDRDEPVAPGEVGEITVTTPFRELSPLLRYRTRDLAAEVVGAPPDPSGLPRTTTVVGRRDDALKVRGALVYPSAIEDVVLTCCPAGSEWRVELDRDGGALDVLRVRVEHPDPSAGAVVAEALVARLALRPLVEVVPPGTFDRFEGKARRVVDRRA